MAQKARAKESREVKVKAVVVGLPCVGKTSVSQALADLLGQTSVDTDKMVEKDAGRSITEIFRVEGEERFRVLEHEALKQALGANVGVVSLGGGALTRNENLSLLDNAVKQGSALIWLTANETTLAARAEFDEQEKGNERKQPLRPLLTANGSSYQEILSAVSVLAKKRNHLFSKANLKVWTDWESAIGVSEVLAFEVPLAKSSQVTIVPAKLSHSDGERSDVIIGNNLLSNLAERVNSLFSHVERIALVSDSNVLSHWGSIVKKELERSGKIVFVYEILAGEQSKNISLLEEISDRMLNDGFSRSDLVVALGGGVVGDLAGLLASLYMRGINLIQLPTSIVAQVDSAIGGKTGVNLKSGKNSLGTFYPARQVISDQSFLSTLADREYLEGLAEVVKYGLIASDEFFVWIEKNIQSILQRDSECMKEFVEVSSLIKLQHVAGDLLDTKGRRALLNFGHTLGHAIERVTDYGRFLHGEAISIGMSFALKFGLDLGITSAEMPERAEALFKQLSLPIRLPQDLSQGAAEALRVLDKEGEKAIFDWEKGEANNIFFEQWVMALRADKKRISSVFDFIVVSKLGCAEIRKTRLFEIVRNLALFAQ